QWVEIQAAQGDRAAVSQLRGWDYRDRRKDRSRTTTTDRCVVLYPPASTVKPYMAMSALLCGIITPQTTFFGAPTWTLPGTQRH
ncbi:penicillin-binding transpeptidase domain-containing protein, partial [Salmonella enterica subsp. enterica serovar Kentucky]|nr:penicillin-binding transpeptidase domain-containing protein [Salmonella enterica subsp. enterica serovar Kentucky]